MMIIIMTITNHPNHHDHEVDQELPADRDPSLRHEVVRVRRRDCRLAARVLVVMKRVVSRVVEVGRRRRRRRVVVMIWIRRRCLYRHFLCIPIEYESMYESSSQLEVLSLGFSWTLDFEKVRDLKRMIISLGCHLTCIYVIDVVK